MQGQLMSVLRRVASASRFLPSPSDGLHALSGRSPHLTSGKVDKRITTCGKRFALLRRRYRLLTSPTYSTPCCTLNGSAPGYSLNGSAFVGAHFASLPGRLMSVLQRVASASRFFADDTVCSLRLRTAHRAVHLTAQHRGIRLTVRPLWALTSPHFRES
jgi:hypothetical protein